MSTCAGTHTNERDWKVVFIGRRPRCALQCDECTVRYSCVQHHGHLIPTSTFTSHDADGARWWRITHACIADLILDQITLGMDPLVDPWPFRPCHFFAWWGGAAATTTHDRFDGDPTVQRRKSSENSATTLLRFAVAKPWKPHHAVMMRDIIQYWTTCMRGNVQYTCTALVIAVLYHITRVHNSSLLYCTVFLLTCAVKYIL